MKQPAQSPGDPARSALSAPPRAGRDRVSDLISSSMSSPDGEMAKLAQIERILADHARYRRDCLNLIASENITSPTVTRLLTNDLSHRYGDYRGIDLGARKYLGNRHIAILEQYVAGLVKTLFGASWAELRPLSGHVAGESVLLALCRPGDTVLELDATGGGHRLAEKLSSAPFVDLNVVSLPFDAASYNVDVDRCRTLIREVRPRLVILGSSSFLFPHPVAAVREMVDELDQAWLVYDASHVLGLIAGGCFQSPLREGAHVMVASTHKTFGGPQGGLVLTNDAELAARVGEAVYPALVTNHHLHRLPALGAACLEWMKFGPDHAGAIIENAVAIARELAGEGLEIVNNGREYTRSHTVLIGTRAYGRGGDLARRLEDAGIIAGPTVLPDLWGRTGIRMGVQELTRRGMTIQDAAPIARLIGDVITGRRMPEDCREDVRSLAGRLRDCRFCLE